MAAAATDAVCVSEQLEQQIAVSRYANPPAYFIHCGFSYIACEITDTCSLVMAVLLVTVPTPLADVCWPLRAKRKNREKRHINYKPQLCFDTMLMLKNN